MILCGGGGASVTRGGCTKKVVVLSVCVKEDGISKK